MSNEYKDWAADVQLEEKYYARLYPFLHKRQFDGSLDTNTQFPLMNIEIPDGWWDLFRQLCDDLKPILEQEGLLDSFYFVQVKEKFNRLICYYSTYNAAVDALLHKYQAMSRYVCTKCGKPAIYESMGYMASYCGDCWNKEMRKYGEIFGTPAPTVRKIDVSNSEVDFSAEWERLYENEF